MVRVARMALILVLAFLTISFVIGVGRPETGPVEKVVLFSMIGACVYAAAKVSTLTEWALRRLAHH
jgi:hypothetical protein